MSEIQVDMFEVQLGAALLLQFKANTGNTVRVLADAGITASGYELDHVNRKLAGAFNTFDKKKQRLDLIIGTHYDADHLDGLIPIIKNKSIEIGEAWMPPVANDTEIHAEDDTIADRNLLGHQFEGEDSERVLDSYLKSKARTCEKLEELQSLANEHVDGRLKPRSERNRLVEKSEKPQDSHIRYFEHHVTAANEIIGAPNDSHADNDIALPFSAETMADDSSKRLFFNPLGFSFLPDWSNDWKNYFHQTWSADPDLAIAQATSMAYIRRAAAKDAINATSLHTVITALKNRGVPISYQMIKDGEPRRFYWKENEARFVPGAQLKSDGPELTLLGPSEGLVKKHWTRLPIGNYLSTLAFKAIPIKSITPSNQLSYVARFTDKQQGLLVCGDAGCVDFKPTRGHYYQPLLDALRSLHIIQVAHHGGNNAHFYRVLLDAHYAQQTDPSLLLLSHAKLDQYRPSKEFSLFIEQVRREGDDVKILFTSQPTADKVKDYRGIIHPTVGPVNTVGDIRIEYDGAKWNVLKHAINV